MNKAIEKFIALYPSQADAARALGIQPATLSHYKTGRRHIPREIAEDIDALTNGEIPKACVIWPEAC